MENTKYKVTAKGNPSGIATTIIDIHKIIIFNIYLATSNFGLDKSLSI